MQKEGLQPLPPYSAREETARTPENRHYFNLPKEVRMGTKNWTAEIRAEAMGDNSTDRQVKIIVKLENRNRELSNQDSEEVVYDEKFPTKKDFGKAWWAKCADAQEKIEESQDDQAVIIEN